MNIEDGRFKKYEGELRKNLSEEEPNGNEIGSIDSTDLKRWV